MRIYLQVGDLTWNAADLASVGGYAVGFARNRSGW